MCHHFGWRLGGNVQFDSLGLSNTQRDFILRQPFLYIFRILYALLLHHTFCFPLCLFDQSPSRQLCFTFRFSIVLDWPVQYLSSASLPHLRNFRAVQISYIISCSLFTTLFRTSNLTLTEFHIIRVVSEVCIYYQSLP